MKLLDLFSVENSFDAEKRLAQLLEEEEIYFLKIENSFDAEKRLAPEIAILISVL